MKRGADAGDPISPQGGEVMLTIGIGLDVIPDARAAKCTQAA